MININVPVDIEELAKSAGKHAAYKLVQELVFYQGDEEFKYMCAKYLLERMHEEDIEKLLSNLK